MQAGKCDVYTARMPLSQRKIDGDAEALFAAQHVRAVQAQRPDGEDVAVVGVRDGAVAVEHAGNALLRPVAAGQLRIEH